MPINHLIPCLGVTRYTIDGYDYDCEYNTSTDCSSCIINGGSIDPRTNKPFIGKHKGHLKKYIRDSLKRYINPEGIVIGSAFNLKETA